MDGHFTRQGVRVSTQVLKQTAERPIDAVIPLPDSCSDLKRLLRCRVYPCVTAKQIQGDRLTVEGEATVSVCYVDADGNIRSFDHAEPFAQEFELPQAVEEGTSEAKLKISYLNYKAVNERRLDVHFSVTVTATVKACLPMDIVTDIDEPSVQQQRGSRPCSSLVGFDEKYLIVSDEMTVPEDGESIRSILRSEPRVIIADTKTLGNKVVVKGDLLVKFLYVGEESGSCATASERFPFSQVFDIPGITEECSCTVDAAIVGCELRPHTDMSGMLRKAMVGAKLTLCVTAYCQGEIPYLTDAYSTERQMTLTRSPMTLDRVAYTVNEPFSVTKKLDIPVESIDRILDVWSEAEVTTVSCSGATLTMKGLLQVCLLALDAGGEPLAFERNVDFECTREMPQPVGSCDCRGQVTPLAVTYSMGRGELEVQSEIQIRMEVVEHTTCDVITDATLGDKLNSKYSASSVVICRAAGGESYWDIAKRYHTSVSAVTGLNGLSGTDLEEDRTLVIPVGSL